MKQLRLSILLTLALALVFGATIHRHAAAQAGTTLVFANVVDNTGAPRKGSVTFILVSAETDSSQAPGGLVVRRPSQSFTLDSQGGFQARLYASRALNPVAYYQMWYTDQKNVKTEFLGLFDVPVASGLVNLATYKVTDTDLLKRYVFASQASLDNNTAILGSLVSPLWDTPKTCANPTSITWNTQGRITAATCASGTQTAPTPPPVPILASVSPNSAIGGGGTFTLTVNGSNFTNSSAVHWNGGARATTYVSATQLTAQITSADILSAGTATITVQTGTTASNGVSFTIVNPATVPTIVALAPGTGVAGGPEFTLGVTGTNFTNSSVVRWNGSNRTTTFQSSTLLTATIPVTDIASAGSFPVTVANGASISNAYNFIVGNAYYFATTGSGTACTLGSPCTFATAIAPGSPVQPGDTLYGRAGTYTSSLATNNTELPGFGIQISGTAQAPVTISNYPGETVIIDGGIEVGSYPINNSGFVFNGAWGNYIYLAASEPGRFRIISSAARTLNEPRPNGIRVWGDGFSLRNIALKDVGNGVYVTSYADKVEIYGLFAQDGGWQADNTQPSTIACRPGSSLVCSTGYRSEGNGQAFYGHGNGTKLLNCLVFGSYGAGMKGYAESGANLVNNQLWEDIISYDNGRGTGASANSRLESFLLGASGSQMQSNTMRRLVGFIPRSRAGLVIRHGYSDLIGSNNSLEDSVFLAGITTAAQVEKQTNITFARNLVVTYSTEPGRILSYSGNNTSTFPPANWDNNQYWQPGSITNGFNDARPGVGENRKFADVFNSLQPWRIVTGYDANGCFQSPLTSCTGANTAVQVRFKANQYALGYAFGSVVTFNSATTFLLDLAGITPVNGSYKVFRADEWLAGGSPIASGTYSGSGAVTVPFQGPHVGDGFGAFVVTP